MKYMIVIMLLVVLTGCTEQVTVIAIEPAEHCGNYKVVTTFDSPSGRFKRCGWWGSVGEMFIYSRLN